MKSAVLFCRGFVIVFLTAFNAVQITHEHTSGAFVVGFLISFVWFLNARTAAHTGSPWLSAAMYGLGAASGTVAGMSAAFEFYRWLDH